LQQKAPGEGFEQELAFIDQNLLALHLTE
jgi:hypothetical protein